ncbi:hypothetical protein LAZ67_10001921 [Cordylochernes scorpioides]|uniref:Uncharacterized protein n=1 Tax=Cordylochernes scorpioides TaxID=51811 RepID=A0ABY6KW86_9ARAC|nr:hypothetical protein LAZ67_10001921 [Cordylochernes scorpioides]
MPRYSLSVRKDVQGFILNMRAGIDAQSFSQLLLKVGNGDLPTDQQGLISLPYQPSIHFEEVSVSTKKPRCVHNVVEATVCPQRRRSHCVLNVVEDTVCSNVVEATLCSQRRRSHIVFSTSKKPRCVHNVVEATVCPQRRRSRSVFSTS